VARARAAVTERERAARVEERAGQIGPQGERKRVFFFLFPFFVNSFETLKQKLFQPNKICKIF
jgi:hypothetical protein